MRKFITTEAKRRALDRAWRRYDVAARNEDGEHMTTLRRWLEDAVALADRGDELPGLPPKHGESYEP